MRTNYQMMVSTASVLLSILLPPCGLAAAGGESRPAPPSGKTTLGIEALYLASKADRPSPAGHAEREARKLEGYLAWLARVERERSVLRELGMAAGNARQAATRIQDFKRSVLTDRPPRPEALLSGDRYYVAAVELETQFTQAMIQHLSAGDSGRARQLASRGRKAIDQKLERMRRELAWYFRQRKLGAVPVIAPSGTASYFGYLAGHVHQ
jgi:hypothetical protein